MEQKYKQVSADGDESLPIDSTLLDEKVDITIETIGAASTEMSSFEI